MDDFLYRQAKLRQPSRHALLVLSRLPGLLLALIIIQGCFAPLLLAKSFPAPVPKPVGQASKITPAKPDVAVEYAQAKEYQRQLEQDGAKAKDRNAWLDGVRRFRKIYLTNKSHDLAVASLFRMGAMYSQMYALFQAPMDLENALKSLNELAAVFPNHPLADDALYTAAQASLLDSRGGEQAEQLLRKIIKAYPQSDHAELARNKLAALKKSQTPASDRVKPSTPSNASINNSPVSSSTVSSSSASSSSSQTNKEEQQAMPLKPVFIQEQAPASSREQAEIQPVKYWSSDAYSRVVIPVSAPVRFSSSLLEKRGDQPRRLYIDFFQTSLAASIKKPLLIEDGLLKQVRSGQYSADTVRVVLDIDSLSDYKIFSLSDPFRVVVDVQGESTGSSGRNKPKPAAPSDSSATASGAPGQQNDPLPVSPKKQSELEQAIPSSASSPFKGSGAEKKAEASSSVKGAVQGQASSDAVGLKTTPTQKNISPVEATTPPSGSGKTTTSNPSLSKRKTNNTSLSLAQQLGLGVRKIVIDPGHGGKDPGAMAFDLKEKEVVLQVAKKVAAILRESYGYEVVLTRSGDTFLPLEERTAVANTQKADLFLSIHVNAHPDAKVGGVETYFLNLATDADAMRVAALENATSTHSISELQDILRDLMKNEKIDESSRLASFVHRSIASGLKKPYKIKNLGVKQAPFYVLIGAEMPAILAEISFITNPAEAKLLQTESYLDQIAERIAAGVGSYVEHHHSASLQSAPKTK